MKIKLQNFNDKLDMKYSLIQNIPPTVLPKGSNPSLIKPLDLAAALQEMQRKEKHVNFTTSMQSAKYRLP